MSRRVALTGATGFIGRHLSAHLVARGFEVIAVVRPESLHTAPEGAAVVRAPLAAAALREAFRGSGTVVHLAGVVNALDSGEYTAVNVEGTRAVAAPIPDAAPVMTAVRPSSENITAKIEGMAHQR